MGGELNNGNNYKKNSIIEVNLRELAFMIDHIEQIILSVKNERNIDQSFQASLIEAFSIFLKYLESKNTKEYNHKLFLEMEFSQPIIEQLHDFHANKGTIFNQTYSDYPNLLPYAVELLLVIYLFFFSNNNLVQYNNITNEFHKEFNNPYETSLIKIRNICKKSKTNGDFIRQFLNTENSILEKYKDENASSDDYNSLMSDLESKRLNLATKPFSETFEKLIEKKNQQLSVNRLLLFIIIAMIAGTLIYFSKNIEFRIFSNNINWGNVTLEATIKASILLFLLYFFRIFYLEYKSLQSQISQLEMKHAAVTFIIPYLQQLHSNEKILSSGKGALESFEKLIFSNLQMSEDRIPSHLDGLEDLAKLISSIRGKG